MSLSQAVQNNNEGIRLMFQGKDREATQRFTASLLNLKTLLNEGIIDHLVSYDCNKEQAHGETSSSLVVHSSVVEVPAPFGITAVNSAADDRGFVFTKAIVLSAPSEGYTRAGDQFLNTHSACCIFNLALLRHLRLAKMVHLNHASLLKAERMYKMCINLLQNTAELNSGCRTAMTVLVASKNNLAQIQLSLGSFFDARQNLNELARLLCRVQHRGFFSANTWNGLLTNTLMLQSADAAPAA